MDMGSATKSDDIFMVFGKTPWFGSFLAVFLLIFFRSYRGAALSLFELISAGRYLVKTCSSVTSDLNEFLVHVENFVDRRLPLQIT